MALNGTSPIRCLAAASLVSLVMGSVHAFSVFLDPLEKELGTGRGAISLTYSFALVAITTAVFFGARLYASSAPSRLVVLAGGAAAGGLVLAATTSSLIGLWVGYSLAFGFANGVGYGLSLQLAGRAFPGREGFAMGTVTAAYAVGAIAAPYPLALGLTDGSATAFAGLAVVIALACLCAAFLLRGISAIPRPSQGTTPLPSLGLLWFAYATAVLSGLMAIGHASGIAREFAPGLSTWIAPMLVAAANMVASLLGGVLTDVLSPKRLVTILPSIAAGALFMLAAVPGDFVLVLGLCIVGGTYGAIISVYPAMIAKTVGPALSARVYGLVFTGWGIAGLVGPGLAGVLFDWTASYTAALLISGSIAFVSGVLAMRLPEGSQA